MGHWTEAGGLPRERERERERERDREREITRKRDGREHPCTRQAT
jgi:hypothetical protein